MISDREALILIVDYLEVLERELFADYDKASDDIRYVVSELIDHIESATGIEVRMYD